MSNIIEIRSLSKSYIYSHLWTKTVTPALRSIDFDVMDNEIFALIGLNGSGKTTTIKLLLGLISIDSGEFRMFGSVKIDNNIKKKIGYLPEIPYFDKKFTPREMLKFWGSLSGMPNSILQERIETVLEYTSLSHVIDRKLKGFSRGMLQRLGLSQALLADPQLLILDEPMGGLDPKGIIDMRNLMKKLKDDGKTIFFSSHQLAEVQKIADRVGILHKGTILETIEPGNDLEKDFLELIGETEE